MTLWICINFHVRGSVRICELNKSQGHKWLFEGRAPRTLLLSVWLWRGQNIVKLSFRRFSVFQSVFSHVEGLF